MKYFNAAIIAITIFWCNISSASPKDCEVNYTLDNNGTITTGWINLGQVSGFLANKKKMCKNRAIQQCSRSKSKLLNYAPVGSPNMQSICNQGKLTVYFDTKVEGKINSKDGYCSVPVSCTRAPCPWTSYQN